MTQDLYRLRPAWLTPACEMAIIAAGVLVGSYAALAMGVA